MVGAMVVLLMASAVSAQRRPPNYSVSSMPETDFDCRDKIIGGYYADPETECQMFHVCVKVPGIGVQDFRFLCPNDTAFDQENQICEDWYNIDCESETLYLSSNFDLYRIGAAQTSSSPRPQSSPKAAPIPLGPSTPRGLPDVPRPNPNPVNSNSVGRHDDDELQRADTGDRRLHQNSQRGDLFRGASSGNFFNSKNGGKDDDEDDYEPDTRYNAFQRQQKTAYTTTTTTAAPFNYQQQQQRKKKVIVHRKPVQQEVTESQSQPEQEDENVEDAYYRTYNNDQRTNYDDPSQAFGQRGNFPATRTTAEPYYQPISSSSAAPTQAPTAAQPTRARYNTIQRAQPTTQQPPSPPSTQKSYSLFYQSKAANNQASSNNNYPTTQPPTSQQYNNYRQSVNPSTNQPATSQQYNNYRQPVNPSTTAEPYNNYYNKQSSSSTDYYNNNNNYYKQSSTTSSTTQAPFKYNNNNNNYYKQPVTTTTTQVPYNTNTNNYYKQSVTTTTTQVPYNANNDYNRNYNTNNYYKQTAATSTARANNYNNYYSTTTQTANNYNQYTTTTQAPYNNYSQYKQPVTTNNNYQRTPSTQQPTYNANNYRSGSNTGESSSSEEYEKAEEQEFLKTAPSSNYKPSDFNVYNRNTNKDTVADNAKPAPFSSTAPVPSTTTFPKQKYYTPGPSSPAPQQTKSNNYYDQPRPFSSASPSSTTTQKYYPSTTAAPARKYTAKVIPNEAAVTTAKRPESTPATIQVQLKDSKKNDYHYEYYDDDVGVYEYGEDPVSDAHFSKIKTKLNKVKPTN